MRCLFCKKNSDNSKSIEHIIPESLGNKSFILPLGFVCDKCNNYFAREVEKPFLHLPEIELLRFQEAIPNKKNRMPMIEGRINGCYPVKLKRRLRHDQVVNEVEVTQDVMDIIFNHSQRDMNIIMPAFTNEIHFSSSLVISRFLAKIALESLAERIKSIENSLEDLVEDRQYDAIRNHARLGMGDVWPCSIRRIYDYDKVWEFKDGKSGQKVHESDFLLIEVSGNIEKDANFVCAELYFIVDLWGIEFVINMAGPEIEGYKMWLREHNNISPLYFGKNKLV